MAELERIVLSSRKWQITDAAAASIDWGELLKKMAGEWGDGKRRTC